MMKHMGGFVINERNKIFEQLGTTNQRGLDVFHSGPRMGEARVKLKESLVQGV